MKKPDWRIWIKSRKECKVWLVRYIKRGLLRKSSEESRLYLRKTDHNLNLANWLKERHKDEIPKMFGKETFYDWVINVYYYAIYHASLSLVSKKGYESKNHSATLCFLIYYYYHAEESIDKEDIELIASLSREDIEMIGRTKEMRERASYDVHETFEQRLAEEAKNRAIEFITKVRKILE